MNINKENADLLLSFGHLSKLQGNLEISVDYYRKSFDIEPNKDAAYELYSLGEDTGKPMAVAGERVANGSRLGISASALFEAWPADETNGFSNVVARAPQAFLHFRGLPSNLFEIRPDTGHVANLILAVVSSDEDWESLDLLTRDLQLDNFNILVLCSAVDSYVKLQGDLSRCLKFIMIEVDHPRRYAQVFLSLLNRNYLNEYETICLVDFSLQQPGQLGSISVGSLHNTSTGAVSSQVVIERGKANEKKAELLNTVSPRVGRKLRDFDFATPVGPVTLFSDIILRDLGGLRLTLKDLTGDKDERSWSTPLN